VVWSTSLAVLLFFRLGDDPFLDYCMKAPEFRPAARIAPRYEGFVYMPWRYRWTIGTGERGGEFCREHGINGGFVDYGRGPLEWLSRYGLRFYSDHVAGKGILHLREDEDRSRFEGSQRDPLAIREPALDAAGLLLSKRRIAESLAGIAEEPLRLAYALDDEVSWGRLSQPCAWRVHGEDRDFTRWLREVRGIQPGADEPRFVGPDELLDQLDRPLSRIDLSAFLDRMSYNDSVLANFTGELVRESNRIDPETPCGLVGCQSPGLFGGYDYAKLMRQVQFAEAYDNGSAPEIARSFTRGRGVPLVSTHFHSDQEGFDRWFVWSRLAHGESGLIGWVDGWFEEERPKAWWAPFGATLREVCGRQGPKLAGARWMHDGIAIYYSHPSIQTGWCLDAEAHGGTWPRRGRDHLLGSAHLTRKAWEHLLNDAGLQYDFLAYDQVVRGGVPAEFDTLILPACFSLSEIEGERLRAFCARGGRLVADYMCGLFDERGRGRKAGLLDDLFGIRRLEDPEKSDFFGPHLWVETDQDRAYDFERYATLFKTYRGASRDGFAVPEADLEREALPPGATYLNLSPQRYLMYRQEDRASPEHRRPFLEPLSVTPWVEVSGERDLEVTRFEKAGRVWLLVFRNPTIPGRGQVQPGVGPVEVKLRFRSEVRNVIDERTGRKLPEGTDFRLTLERSEAIFLSLNVMK